MDFTELGRYLRETRETQERTIEEAEAALKIRRRILEAFERGAFDVPALSPVQVRGFIRNYARYLSLDSDKIIDYYDVAVAEANDPTPRRKRQEDPSEEALKPRRGRRRRRPSAVPTPVAKKSPTDTDPSLPAVPEAFVTMGEAAAARTRRRRNSLSRGVLLLVTLAAVSVIAFVTYQLAQQPAGILDFEELPDIIVTSSPTPSLTPLATSTSAQVALQSTQAVHLTQVYSGQGVMVSILMQQRTWLRVVADGQERYVGVAPPGAEVTVGMNEFINEVTLSAANASALLVTYNGEPQRSFGRRGQQVEVVFREDGSEVNSGASFEATPEFTNTPPPTAQIDVGALIEAQTPTATEGPSPTPTLTLTPSETPEPSPTPTWTSIPTNTPTTTPTEGPSPTATATASATPSPTPTVTLTPSETPFPTAVLPLRVTATPSPAKDS